MLDLIKFTVAILATWRISASLYYGKEFAWLRDRLTFALDDDDVPLLFWGRQISCFWCVSFWAALVVWPIAWWFALWMLGPFALSGAVILLSGGSRILWREMVK